MRVLTLNVHDPDRHAAAEIADFLDRSGAEVIALTECRLRTAEEVARRLGCAGLVHAWAPYWGNALLTRTLPVVGSESVELPMSAHGETRSAAVAAVDAPFGTTRFVATHLDHVTEAARLAQLRYLADVEWLDLGASVLLGDLNALTRADYDDRRWRRIGEQRERAGLRPAAFDLTEWVRETLELEDAHDARPEGARFAPTCPYGTRVDYVLVGRRSGLRAAPGTYRVLGAMAEGLTDHDAVTVALEALAQSRGALRDSNGASPTRTC